MSTENKLFGNLSFKKRIWNQLWDHKHKVEVNARRHETMYVLYNRIQSVFKFISGTLVGTGALIVGIENESSRSVLFMNVIAVMLQVGEKVFNIEQSKMGHKTSAEKYKDVCGDIDRMMTIKRGTEQLTEAFDIISTRITSIDRMSPYIMSWVVNKYRLEIPPTPELPFTPNTSMKDITLYVDYVWSDVYPVLGTHEAYSTPDNVAHFLTDSSGSIIHMDEKYYNFVGNSEHPLYGFSWVAYIHRDDVESVIRQWQEAVLVHEPFIKKFRFKHQDGSIIHVVAEAYPKFSSSSVFLGFEGILLYMKDNQWRDIDM